MTKAKRLLLARKMRSDGLPYDKIGQHFGVSGAAVYYWLHGIRRRAGGRPRQAATPRATQSTVIRRVPVLGAQGSMSCYDAFVSLPRISILEPAHAA